MVLDFYSWPMMVTRDDSYTKEWGIIYSPRIKVLEILRERIGNIKMRRRGSSRRKLHRPPRH